MTDTSVRATASYCYVASRSAWDAKFADKADRITAFEGEGLYNKATGELLATQREGVCAPFVIGDIPDHIGPSGKIVTSRSNQRDEYKRSDTLPWEPINDRPRGFVDPRVAKARGVKVSDKTLTWLHEKRAKGIAPSKPKLDYVAKKKRDTAIREVLAKHGVSD